MNLIETKKKRTGWRVVGAALLAALLLAASCVAGLRFGIRPVFAQSSPSPLTHTFLAPAQSLAAIAKPEPFAAKPSQQKTVVAKTMPIGVGGLALADAGDDLKPVSFTIGQTQFAPGDTIAIDEIRGTTDRIATGNLYEIKGRYTLASRDKALLAANVTTSVDSHAPGMDVERLAVARGSGRFQLWKYMRDPGRLHLSFYPTDDGSSFASIYLEPGTVASAPEKQTSSPAKLPQFNLKFGVITGTFPVAEAAGKTVRFSAWIKTENVHDGYAGLWWRVNGPGKGNDRPTLAFDNSFNRVIADQPGAGDGTVRGATGTTPWTLYQFELPVASTASNINFGVLLTGTGTAWVDSMKVELDGQPFSAPQYYVDLASPGARNFYIGDGGNGPAAYKGGVDTTVSHSGKQSLKLQYVGNSSAIPQ